MALNRRATALGRDLLNRLHEHAGTALDSKAAPMHRRSSATLVGRQLDMARRLAAAAPELCTAEQLARLEAAAAIEIDPMPRTD